MLNKRILYIVCPIVLGLMSAWLLSAIFKGYSVIPKPLPMPEIKTNIHKFSIAEGAKTVIEKNIFNLTLTPVVQPTSSDEGITPAGVTVTPFNGKLIGIINNKPQNIGIAILNLEGSTISIKIGSEKNGFKLISIDNITAVIEKNNRRYSVKLEGGENSVKTTTSQTNKMAAPTTAPSSGEILNVSIQKTNLKAEIQDLNKVLQSAVAAPLYNNGQFLGYRLTRIQDTSPLKKIGLNQGDIITRVNGTELLTPEPLFNLMTQIDDIAAVSIDIIRDNNKKTLFVELQ